MLKLYKVANNVEVGVDEAGRGCLMGRVYAAAVIMPDEYPDEIYKQIKDSKKLSAKKRSILKEYIEENAISYGIGYVEPQVIDKINIYNATMKAMHYALDNINMEVDRLLIDGANFKPYLNKNNDYTSYDCIVKGDDTYLSIAAASILAKCYRDEYVNSIIELNSDYSVYGWNTNKGYGTAFHMDMINKHGKTDFHRKTFNIKKLQLKIQYK